MRWGPEGQLQNTSSPSHARLHATLACVMLVLRSPKQTSGVEGLCQPSPVRTGPVLGGPLFAPPHWPHLGESLRQPKTLLVPLTKGFKSRNKIRGSYRAALALGKRWTVALLVGVHARAPLDSGPCATASQRYCQGITVNDSL